MNVLEGLNPEQEQAVKHFKGPLLILAGAACKYNNCIYNKIKILRNSTLHAIGTSSYW